jgi:hypothetical protein
MNQERPYIFDFSDYTELCEKAIELLENEYNSYLAKRRGIISIHDFDKIIFPTILQQLSPLTDHEVHVLEALFDTFCGGITMFGSDMAFEMIKIQASGIGPKF